MAMPVYERVYDKTEFNSEEHINAVFVSTSKKHPDLVFVCYSSIMRVWIEGYKRRSDIPSYIIERLSERFFLQNGEKVYPTAGQLAKIEQCAYSRE